MTVTARFAVLLRGVNVGKAKRVPMAAFRELLADLGYGEVRTLLNSGNAVFAGAARAEGAHARDIHDALVERRGVDAPVIVKSAASFAAIAAGNPLAAVATDPTRLLVVFAADAKALQSLASLAELAGPPGAFHLGPHAAYLWCPDGILESPAAAALQGKAGVAATTRNWGTVTKLAAMLASGTSPA